jgi:hypothetical protein
LSASAHERFAVGDRVHARGLSGSGHTRLPGYMRDRRGVVVAVRGHFPLADDRAAGAASPRIEPLYTVAFTGRELWGDASEADISVNADLWESYLEKTP